MASTPDPVHLSGPHRDTLSQLFRHPTSHNIEWPAVLSLLGAVGTVEERHDGKYLVTVGSESKVFERPLHKDIDTSTVVDLRTILRTAGYGSQVQD
jgi:hypothetical protein